MSSARHRHRFRRGMSLTELMVSLTVSSLLLAMAATLIALLLRAQATGQSEDLAASETARLARQFRGDVHAARAVAPPPARPDPALLVQLQAPRGRSVAYRLAKKGIERVEQQDGAVARRDTYTLLPGTGARVERSQAPPGLLRLVVWRQAKKPPPQGRADDHDDRAVHVEAVLDRDGRFVREVPDAR